MSDDAGIADSLPPPRDDEPTDLRRDIIDELNDHLDCAVQREVLRGQDETDARRAAIQRFGDLHKIARQLWWYAMKEQVMKGRILLMSGTAGSIILVLLIMFGVFFYMSIHMQERYLEAFVSKLDSIASSSPEVAQSASLEWGSLTIELLDEHGKPMADWPVHVIGKMYSSDTIFPRTLQTDTNGFAKLDPIRTGTGYNIRLEGPNHWKYLIGDFDLILEPGEHKVHTIRSPLSEADEPVPTSFDFDWPRGWTGQGQQMRYRFIREQSVLDNGTWRQPTWLINCEEGKLKSAHKNYYYTQGLAGEGSGDVPATLTDAKRQPRGYGGGYVPVVVGQGLADERSIDVPVTLTDAKLHLPAGRYVILLARVIPSPSYTQPKWPGLLKSRIEYPPGEFTFDVKPGDENHVHIPLPSGVVDWSVADRDNETIVDPGNGLGPPAP